MISDWLNRDVDFDHDISIIMNDGRDGRMASSFQRFTTFEIVDIYISQINVMVERQTR